MIDDQKFKEFRDDLISKRVAKVGASLAQYNALRDLILGLLRNDAMTLRALLDCLASEPYSIDLMESMGLVGLILDDLYISDDLVIQHRVVREELTLETVYALRNELHL